MVSFLLPTAPIIFDCDGVLVDSEPLSCATFVRHLNQNGFSITAEEFSNAYLGKSRADITAGLSVKGFVADEKFWENFSHDLFELFRKELKPMPGILEFLEKIKNPRAVASSSTPDRLDLALEITGIKNFFAGKIFNATQVKHGKPFPDLFLLVAEKMEWNPAECVVIEDSPSGIFAAKRAGMRVAAFVGGSHMTPERINDLKKLSPDFWINDFL